MLYTIAFTSASYEPIFSSFLTTVHKFNNGKHYTIALESGLPDFFFQQWALCFVHAILNIANIV